MIISGTVAEWEQWTAMAFPDTGDYVVPDALDLVSIDREADRGRYAETNLWMQHAWPARLGYPGRTLTPGSCSARGARLGAGTSLTPEGRSISIDSPRKIGVFLTCRSMAEADIE